MNEKTAWQIGSQDRELVVVPSGRVTKGRYQENVVRGEDMVVELPVDENGLSVT